MVIFPTCQYYLSEFHALQTCLSSLDFWVLKVPSGLSREQKCVLNRIVEAYRRYRAQDGTHFRVCTVCLHGFSASLIVPD